MTSHTEAIEVLKSLIRQPSFSGAEDKTSRIIEEFLESKGAQPVRIRNNVIARSDNFDPQRPTLLLNSHHDTVKPTGDWETDPFLPTEKNGKIIGLGSNDAGASLISLLFAFLNFKNHALPFNLVFAASAEEENSGPNGMKHLVEQLKGISLAIVGEPTQLALAVAEKGLMVLELCAMGRAGHAARDEGINAISIALKDIQWMESYEFPKVSEMLGKVHLAVTVIKGGHLHNVVPSQCHFTVDIRTTDMYTHEEIIDTLKKNIQSKIVKGPGHLNPSSISTDHPIVSGAKDLGIRIYGSPTISDQALMPWPSVKIGPGDSARSHTANEYIYETEISEGIRTYEAIIRNLVKTGLPPFPSH